MDRVSLKVRSLHWAVSDEDIAESTARIPRNLKYGGGESRTDDIDLSDTEAGGANPLSTPRSEITLAPASTPSAMQNIEEPLIKGSRDSDVSESVRREKDEKVKSLLRRMIPVCSPVH